ncbi:hypothetical protein FOA43_001623 [Brettanomyces nanus]|uniref:non-specific serine/threonine protein kinase n=1 Tax=Eeniella nana TaxID=13502 RepID=A0A875RU86_EENNA|nr:uncharacterized protein FOA43_001623 [Brettanomyces nanus]QPG74297.1 hypothetical protein FOA43_001623 [Brettanomyces nanus]
MRDLTNIILNNKYQFQKKIGSGSYGIVYSARHLYTGKSYAIKIILKHQAPKNSENGNGGRNNKQLLQELERSLLYQALMNNGTLMTNLLSMEMIIRKGYNCKILREMSLQLRVHKHPNILSIYKVYGVREALFVIMDYYPEGDLFGTIVDKQRYSSDPFLIKSVFIQLVDAITYCHSKGVYHCDLKPENILVAENGTKLILADFGLALREPYTESNVCCGSSYYMSPERIQNFCQGFDSKDSKVIHIDRLLRPNSEGMRQNVRFPTSAGDVWSLAIILINLISIRNPWLKASLNDTTFRAFVKDPSVLLKILPISKEIFHVLCRYLKLNPWERGNLFEFRNDVLACQKLSEAGPLSIDSRIDSMDIITTESQQFNVNKFDVCMVPVDHVSMNRMRSKENSGIENIEQEKEYIIGLPIADEPDSNNVATAATAQGIYGPDNPGNGKECGSCVACGYGVPGSEPYESIESINKQAAIEQELNNEHQEHEQRALAMHHSKKSPGVLRKIFGRRHTHQSSGDVESDTQQNQQPQQTQIQQQQPQQTQIQQQQQQPQQTQTQQRQPQQSQQTHNRHHQSQHSSRYHQQQPQYQLSPQQLQQYQLQQQLQQQRLRQQAGLMQTQIQGQGQGQGPFSGAGVQGRRITEENLRNHNRTFYPSGTTNNKYSKIRVDSLLSDYKSIFPSSDVSGNVNLPTANNFIIDSGANNHTSGEGSTTDTTTGNASAQTSSVSSIDGAEPCEKMEVIIHKPEENNSPKMNNLTEDLSMVSVMMNYKLLDSE